LRQLRLAQQTASPCAIKVVERQCGLHVAGTGGRQTRRGLQSVILRAKLDVASSSVDRGHTQCRSRQMQAVAVAA
jgi:hypothetical protein